MNRNFTLSLRHALLGWLRWLAFERFWQTPLFPCATAAKS
ncbi:hypothetical protein RB7386 [Rhodopirellula baltica SH 1]|uniref:Uncharacterized protein n=1 Tax=Rhodopirellula baltica (strain DSM 10527 / NCIMB 13988 / SH1) TaxID=243090 RepID=Q7UNT6_RHOBA|nr:hypothetical protein RB7386 [Rhodopirellula baltica SH 1]